MKKKLLAGILGTSCVISTSMAQGFDPTAEATTAATTMGTVFGIVFTAILGIVLGRKVINFFKS